VLAIPDIEVVETLTSSVNPLVAYCHTSAAETPPEPATAREYPAEGLGYEEISVDHTVPAIPTIEVVEMLTGDVTLPTAPVTEPTAPVTEPTAPLTLPTLPERLPVMLPVRLKD
jgi:hypothetical protein